MKNKKIYWIIGAVLLLLIIAAVIKSKTSDKTEKVIVSVVELRTIVEMVSANGKVQPETEVKISPEVSGEILEINVKEGQQVKKGMLLAKINPDLLLSNKQRLAAAMNTSKANLANAKARLAQVKAQYINAEASFIRNEKIWKEGAISDAEYDQAKSSFEVAKAEVEAAEQSVQASEYTVKSAGASLKEAEDNLLRTTIFAPMDGTVSMMGVEEGERVVATLQMAGTEMMRIADLSNMEVNVEVNENDIVRVTMGDTAEIEVDAYLGRKFSGIVTEIANTANSTVISADQVTTFNVTIKILRESYADLIPEDKPHLSPFRPGMSATVEIRTESTDNITAVPIQAVTTREDTVSEKHFDQDRKQMISTTDLEEVVFLFDDGIAKKHRVTTGIQDSRYIRIISGLEEGQKIISGPYSAVSKNLEDGSPVTEVKEDDLYKK